MIAEKLNVECEVAKGMPMTPWYVKILDEISGPFTADEVRAMAADGRLRPEYWVRKGVEGKWNSAQRIKGISFGQAESPVPSQESPEAARSTRFCPFCAEEIFLEAKKCKHCGEFISSPKKTIPQGPDSTNRFVFGTISGSSTDNQRLLDIAQSQKYVIYVLLGQFVALVVSAALPLFGLLLLVATLAFQLFFIFQFCTATFPRETGVILGIFSLVPILGIVILLVVNSVATKILKQNGIPVEFMGVPQSAIDELASRNKK